MSTLKIAMIKSMIHKDVKSVFILTNSLLKGGAEKQSILLAQSLQKHLDTTLIVYYGDQIDSTFLELANHYNIRLIILNGSYHFIKLIHLLKIFRSNRNSIIFSYLATTNFINAIIGTIAGIKYKIGGIRNAELETLKMIIQKFLHNNFLTLTIFNNHSGAKYYSTHGFNPKKIHVIENGFDLNTQPIKRKNRVLIQILTVARFVDQKDYPTAIKTIKLLLKRIKIDHSISIHYHIVGYGKLENLIRDLIQEFELNDYISLHIKPNNLFDIYQDADIYLSTSLFEGTSNSLLEAMSYSLPIVATRGGDNELLIDNDQSGYICEIGNAKQMSERLYDLVLNYEKRLSFGLSGYLKLAKNYSLDAFEKKYLDFIHAL